MKKVAALLILTAAMPLAACSHSGEYNNGYNDNGYYSNNNKNNYEKAGYYSQDEDNQYSNNGQDHNWKRKKVSMMVSELFKKCDSNGDGYITWKEYKSCAYRMFKKADTNHDGKLSRREVYAHKLQRMRMMHRMNEGSYNDERDYNDSDESYNSNRIRYHSNPANMSTNDNESNGFSNNGYSHDAANVNRYNQNR